MEFVLCSVSAYTLPVEHTLFNPCSTCLNVWEKCQGTTLTRIILFNLILNKCDQTPWQSDSGENKTHDELK